MNDPGTERGGWQTSTRVCKGRAVPKHAGHNPHSVRKAAPREAPIELASPHSLKRCRAASKPTYAAARNRPEIRTHCCKEDGFPAYRTVQRYKARLHIQSQLRNTLAVALSLPAGSTPLQGLLSRRLLPSEKRAQVWRKPCCLAASRKAAPPRLTLRHRCLQALNRLHTIAAEGQVVPSSLRAHPAQQVVSSPEPAVDEEQEEAETSAVDCSEHW